MIDIVGKQQASIFLPNADFVPSPANISNLLNLFDDKGLLPATFQEIGFQSVKPKPRIILNSPDNEWVIHFATERIDIENNPTDPNRQNKESSEDFFRNVEDFFSRIFTLLKKKGNRISFNTSFLLKSMTKKQLDAVFPKMLKPTEFYKKNVPFEWQARIVARKEIDICGNPETINVITNVNRIIGQMMIQQAVTK